MITLKKKAEIMQADGFSRSKYHGLTTSIENQWSFYFLNPTVALYCLNRLK